MAATYTFPNHTSGDTYLGAVFTLTDANGAAIDLTGGTVACRFRFGSKTGTKFRDITISITNAAGGEITIPEQIFDWPAGTWFYDIEVVIGAQVFTYIEGTMRIIPSVTN